MKCYIHNDRDAIAMCTNCNSVICEECRVMINGRNICKRCLENSNNQSFNQEFNNTTSNSQGEYTNNSNSSNQTPNNKNVSVDINITKLLVWIGLIFCIINVFNYVFLASKDIFSIIPFFNNITLNLSFVLYDLLFLLGFILLLGINLSKISKLTFINNDNIGALTLLSIALMGLGVIIITIFANGLGLSTILGALFRSPMWLIPVTCTLVTIFGLYKHKVNINITY